MIMQAIAVALFTLVATVSGAGSAESAPAPDVVRLGLLSAKTALNWPTYALLHPRTGLLSRCGLRARIVEFEDPAVLLKAVSTGGVHALAPVLTDYMLNDRRMAEQTAIVAAVAHKLPYYVVLDREHRSVARVSEALKGRLVGMSGYVRGIDAVFTNLLSAAGLRVGEDYRVRHLGGSRRRSEALDTGSVSAVFVEAEDARALEQAGHRRVESAFATDLFAVAVFNRSWMTGRTRPEAQRLLGALFESSRWLMDPANRSDAIAVLEVSLKIPRANAESAYDDYIRKSVFSETGEFATAPGYATAMDATFLSRLVDDSLRRDAQSGCR